VVATARCAALAAAEHRPLACAARRHSVRCRGSCQLPNLRPASRTDCKSTFRSAFASMPSSPQRATFRIRRCYVLSCHFFISLIKIDNSRQEEYPFIRWAGRFGRQRPSHLCSPIEDADEKACRVAWRHWPTAIPRGTTASSSNTATTYLARLRFGMEAVM